MVSKKKKEDTFDKRSVWFILSMIHVNTFRDRARNRAQPRHLDQLEATEPRQVKARARDDGQSGFLSAGEHAGDAEEHRAIDLQQQVRDHVDHRGSARSLSQGPG